MKKTPRARGLPRIPALALGLALALSGCASQRPMAAFATDGCSMFPDGALIGKADWCSCCVAHDLAYWQGGTSSERLKADQDLRNCVRAATSDPALADTMLAGVRLGGGPYFPTSYRWGYGWSWGRGYGPLSAEEQAQAAQLRTRYMAENPNLSCHGTAGTYSDTHAGR